MSDETPTREFDAPGGDAPSDGHPPVPPAGQAPSAGGEKRSRRALVILAVVGGVLLIALIVVLVLLFGRGGAAPAATGTPTPTASSASPTPTPTATSPTSTPTPTPTPTTTDPPPEPPPTPTLISSYTASVQKVDCSGGGPVPVTFSWAASGDTLWFGVGTTNAKDEPFDSFPLNYTMDFDYQCGQAAHSQKYTITVQSGGEIQSETIVISE